MTKSIIPSLQNYNSLSEQHQDHPFPYCTLLWRRDQLWVKSQGEIKQLYLPALYNEKSLVQCLKHSPVSLVSIDAKLGEAWLKFWAVACEQANKPIFLRLPSGNNQLSTQDNSPFSWLIRGFDWIFALVSLLIISPIMLGLIFMRWIYSPKAIFSHEWHVGERGKLFRAIKFHTQNITPIDRWMHKYGLHNLPQLLNVLGGDMRFFGAHCLPLEYAVKLSLEGEMPLNEVGEIPKGWQVNSESKLLSLDGQTM